MVVFLSRLMMPMPGTEHLLARCGNCDNVFMWQNPFWHEKKNLPKSKKCKHCGEWNRFVRNLNTIYQPGIIRSAKDDGNA